MRVSRGRHIVDRVESRIARPLALAICAGPWQTFTMRDHPYPDSQLRRILDSVKTIAAVGVSLNPVRPSHYVGRFMNMRGYQVIPVNPVYKGQQAFGQKVRASLSKIPEKCGPVHMVDIFRRSEEAGRVVDEALEVLLDRGLRVIWMQIGVIDKAAARRAEAKGVEVLMDVCPKMEYQRLNFELSRAGFVSGIISSKLRP